MPWTVERWFLDRLVLRTGFPGAGIDGGVYIVVVAAAAAGRELAMSGACSSQYCHSWWTYIAL